MPDTRETHLFHSSVPYVEQRIKAAAVYCSDGRFGEQFDDFLYNVLKLDRYDRLAIPGGPAVLATNSKTFTEHRAADKQIGFLLDVHDINRMVLIQHLGCAHYAQLLRLPPKEAKQRQLDDVHRAAEHLHKLAPDLKIEAFLASVHNNAVDFDPIPM
ncbi:MAG: hypothetical protein GC159_09700 [Phycisphaera sp.]|nr:hypothetical protein [Phycisphaera sp.]